MYVWSHTKFGTDWFSRFDVYWIKTDRQAKYIYIDYRFLIDFMHNKAPSIFEGSEYYVLSIIRHPVFYEAWCRLRITCKVRCEI